MERSTLIWLIVAACLVVLGASLFTVVMALNHWDFTTLGTIRYETSTHQLTEDFRNIRINSETADIRLLPSEDGSCALVCHEVANEKHSVRVQDGTLRIQVHSNKKWYEYIGINFGTPKITLYLPETEYGALTIEARTGNVEVPKNFTFETMDVTVSTGKITSEASASGPVKFKSTTGSIRLEGVSAEALELSVSTGKVTVSNVTCPGDMQITVSTGDATVTDVSCNSLHSTGSTGDLTLHNVIAAAQFSIDRSTGDVTFEGSDAAEINVITSTGHVQGTLLSDKVFITKTNTGKVEVPQTTTGGKCEIKTGTGDIRIEIQ